jgi:hypothetical protein
LIPKIDDVIAVAGWEERFAKGLHLDVTANRPTHVFLFVFEEYLSQTDTSRKEISKFAEDNSVRYTEIPVRRDPRALWNKIRDTFSTDHWSGRSVLVDITTMPREVIWWTFSRLRAANCSVSYIYYRPTGYARDWLTRDTDQPRLVYQHSGVSVFGRPTCLLLMSGFDTDRAAQLIQFFEPAKVLIGVQVGTQHDNQTKNVERTKKLLERKSDINFFDVDAFSPDHGLAEIDSAIDPYVTNFNIVAASLGPKPSAVALYFLQRKHTDIALAYAPSKEFNMAYSGGIGEPLHGVVAG